jgi:hypothetical protein
MFGYKGKLLSYFKDKNCLTFLTVKPFFLRVLQILKKYLNILLFFYLHSLFVCNSSKTQVKFQKIWHTACVNFERIVLFAIQKYLQRKLKLDNGITKITCYKVLCFDKDCQYEFRLIVNL